MCRFITDIFGGGGSSEPAPAPTIVLPAQPAAPVIPAPVEDPNASEKAAEAASAAIRKAKRQRQTDPAIATSALGVNDNAPAVAQKLLGV